MPLPDDGPTTVEAVKAYMGIGDEADDDRLALIVPAVNDVVRELPIIANVDVTDILAEDYEWPNRVVHGATMLAGRLLGRHNSPNGVAAFGDQGPVYIQRNDPDIALTLQMGSHAKPGVG